MNKKICILLEFLLNSPDNHINLTTIASRFNMNEKTVKNHINSILLFLKDNNFDRIISIKENKVIVKREGINKQQLIDVVSKLTLYEYRFLKSERRELIKFIFLISETGKKIEALSNVFSVSPATIVSDIDFIKKQSNVPIGYLKIKRDGIFFLGTEVERRIFIFESLQKLDAFPNGFNYDKKLYKLQITKFIEQFVPLSKTKKHISSIINDVLEKYAIDVSDLNFDKLCNFYTICFLRISTNHYIKNDEFSFSQFNKLDSSFILSETLLRISFNLTESTLSLETLFICKNLKDFNLLHSNLDNSYLSIFLGVRIFLEEVSLSFSPLLKSDPSLAYLLARHLLEVDNSSRFFALDNDMKRYLLSKYLKEFDVIKNSAYLLNPVLKKDLDENQLCFLLMHIVSSYEKIIQRMPKIKTMIVCNSGISTANLIASMLSKVLSIDIVSISSSKSVLHNLKEGPLDLIITTIELENYGIPQVKISVLLKPEELQKVEDEINLIYRDSYGMRKISNLPTSNLSNSFIDNKFSDSFFKLLTPNRIELYKKTDSWQSSIKLAGALLVKSDIVSENYVNKMIEIVSELGPYIIMAPNVAVAHARPIDGHKRNGVSLVVLNNPIKFENDNHEINIIIALSLSNSQEENQGIIKSMHNFISNGRLIKNLMNSSSSKEVYELIKEFFEN